MKRRGGFAIRAALVAAAACVAASAQAATWTGGASGILDDAANWDDDTATTAMAFTNDVTLSLSADASVYDVFWNDTTLSDNRQKNRTVVFNLSEHTLRNLTSGTMNGEGATFRFAGGTFLNVADGGTTNTVTFDNQNRCHSIVLEATGSGTKFVSSIESRVRNTTYPGASFRVLNGAEAFGTYIFGGIGSTNEVSGGARMTFDSNFLFGYYGTTPNNDNLFVIDNATLTAANPSSAGILYVGQAASNGTSGQGENNKLVARNGATVDVFQLAIGSGAVTNCEMLVTGSGTKFTQVAASGVTSVIGNGAGSVSNRLVVADGAAAVFNRVLVVGGGSSVGGTLRVESGAVVTNKSPVYIGHNNNGYKNGISARVSVVGSGSEWYSGNIWNYLINGTGDAADAPEVYIGDGAKFNGKLHIAGVGCRFVIDNATATLINFMTTLDREGVAASTGATIRLAGSNASLTLDQLNDSSNTFGGSEVFEFEIPANGWAAAPFTIKQAFTIPDGVKVKIDKASVKAYLAANPQGGTVPLLSTGSANRAMTIVNATTLSADLPDNCSLSCSGDVLSAKIKPSGLTVIFR